MVGYRHNFYLPAGPLGVSIAISNGSCVVVSVRNLTSPLLEGDEILLVNGHRLAALDNPLSWLKMIQHRGLTISGWRLTILRCCKRGGEDVASTLRSASLHQEALAGQSNGVNSSFSHSDLARPSQLHLQEPNQQPAQPGLFASPHHPHQPCCPPTYMMPMKMKAAQQPMYWHESQMLSSPYFKPGSHIFYPPPHQMMNPASYYFHQAQVSGGDPSLAAEKTEDIEKRKENKSGTDADPVPKADGSTEKESDGETEAETKEEAKPEAKFDEPKEVIRAAQAGAETEKSKDAANNEDFDNSKKSTIVAGKEAEGVKGDAKEKEETGAAKQDEKAESKADETMEDAKTECGNRKSPPELKQSGGLSDRSFDSTCRTSTKNPRNESLPDDVGSGISFEPPLNGQAETSEPPSSSKQTKPQPPLGSAQEDSSTATSGSFSHSRYSFDSSSEYEPSFDSSSENEPDEIGSGPVVPRAMTKRRRAFMLPPLGSAQEDSSTAASGSFSHSRYSFDSPFEYEPDEIGSGLVVSRAMAKRKRAFIQHCNTDVFIRPKKSRRHGIGMFFIRDFERGTDIVNTIPGVRETDIVLLTRREIESQILFGDVKKLIYDMFPPKRHRSDRMEDTFELPAKGLNHLPVHYYMNATHTGSSNIYASDERDEMGYVKAKTSRGGRCGEEALWRSHARKVQSAADYDFHTASLDHAAYTVHDAGNEESAAIAAAKEREIKRLREENAKLLARSKRPWRALSAGGCDAGKYGQAYFKEDKEWVDVFIEGFNEEKETYRFSFILKDEDGRPLLEEGKAIKQSDWDDVSVGDPSVRVQDDT